VIGSVGEGRVLLFDLCSERYLGRVGLEGMVTYGGRQPKLHRLAKADTIADAFSRDVHKLRPFAGRRARENVRRQFRCCLCNVM
jgi:hypothetical protein